MSDIHPDDKHAAAEYFNILYHQFEECSDQVLAEPINGYQFKSLLWVLKELLHERR
ncbi:hypothetical protein UFOVP255_25 [uncultured Caudovirales phage]|uniref:Uncharacterized protein n=1 Tax=uncultured Caudovirales phage TaxID=2100421 RepID=A0A6J5LEQ4_9CAUD|nr:hypothetical protein UFOVP255_25 [uncultured Caudovirales phage]